MSPKRADACKWTGLYFRRCFNGIVCLCPDARMPQNGACIQARQGFTLPHRKIMSCEVPIPSKHAEIIGRPADRGKVGGKCSVEGKRPNDREGDGDGRIRAVISKRLQKEFCNPGPYALRVVILAGFHSVCICWGWFDA